ncbi:DUF2635 domain-containing protein [Paludibacterium sp. dN 18-1]|uniref:DUF2635 domain-containing protein n=2 Tax=Paludibacterium denitrificans TaxID=2675226 RepID=A0A844G9W5_9NEIS|nr:DUF2635 domain-containing protein [Paludibacterium denitrificans]
MKVRLEVGEGYLPDDGKEVPLTTYYRRRLADKDVVDITDEPAATMEEVAPPHTDNEVIAHG